MTEQKNFVDPNEVNYCFYCDTSKSDEDGQLFVCWSCGGKIGHERHLDIFHEDKNLTHQYITIKDFMNLTKQKEGITDLTDNAMNLDVYDIQIVDTSYDKSDGAAYYHLQISLEGECAVKIKKRFSDFVAFHSSLKSISPKIKNLPSMPSRIKLFQKPGDKQFLEMRRLHLNDYLHDVLHHADIDNQHIMDFVLPDVQRMLFSKSNEKNEAGDQQPDDKNKTKDAKFENGEEKSLTVPKSHLVSGAMIFASNSIKGSSTDIPIGVLSVSRGLTASAVGLTAVGFAVYFVCESMWYVRKWYKKEITGKQLAEQVVKSLTVNTASFGGAVGGLALGAAIGAAGGPIGIVVGSIIGGIAGAVIAGIGTSVLFTKLQKMFSGDRGENIQKALDYFDLDPECTEAEINRKFRNNVVLHHPDKRRPQKQQEPGAPKASDEMKEDERDVLLQSDYFYRGILLEYVKDRDSPLASFLVKRVKELWSKRNVEPPKLLQFANKAEAKEATQKQIRREVKANKIRSKYRSKIQILRATARENLSNILHNREIVRHLELCIFTECDIEIDDQEEYVESIYNIVTTLEGDEDILKKIETGELKVSEFVFSVLGKWKCRNCDSTNGNVLICGTCDSPRPDRAIVLAVGDRVVTHGLKTERFNAQAGEVVVLRHQNTPPAKLAIRFDDASLGIKILKKINLSKQVEELE